MRRASTFSGCSFGGNFAGGTSHPVAEGGKAPVSACKPLCAIFLRKPGPLPTFTRESKRGPFVREVEKHDERWSEIELLLIVGVHREPGNVCI